MNFDINTVIADMISAIKGTVVNNAGKIESAARLFLERDKDRLKMLAELRITGELTAEEFKSRLEDQKLVIEAELNALEVIAKAVAQEAANAAINVLEKAVEVAIKGIL